MKPNNSRPKHLSNAVIRSILKLRDEGWSQEAIADRFDVSQTTISNIFRGLVYGRITGIAALPRKKHLVARIPRRKRAA
jgi:hypothetical protein